MRRLPPVDYWNSHRYLSVFSLRTRGTGVFRPRLIPSAGGLFLFFLEQLQEGQEVTLSLVEGAIARTAGDSGSLGRGRMGLPFPGRRRCPRAVIQHQLAAGPFQGLNLQACVAAAPPLVLRRAPQAHLPAVFESNRLRQRRFIRRPPANKLGSSSTATANWGIKPGKET